MIVEGIVNSFKKELLDGVHTPSDQYRIALYTEAAVLSAQTTLYTTLGEALGDGYKAGGAVLSGRRSLLDLTIAILTFDTIVWPRASISARGALIYNYSKNNRAVAVIDLGRVYTSTNGDFTVEFPEPTAALALIRIG